MKANNNFNLTGRLARDPEYFPGTMPRARLRLAVDGYDRQTKSKKADFFTITVFGNQADSANQYLNKGSYLSITGELRDNQYTDKQGNQRYETQLIGNDTVFGPKTTPGQPAGGGDPATQSDDADPFGFGN